MMNRMTVCGAAMLALLLTVGVSDVVGQLAPQVDRSVRGDAFAGRAGATRGSGAAALERIIRLRDRLELTDDQVSRLDALRSEVVARSGRHAAELDELRSQMRAGTIERSAARERMQALRESRGCGDPRRRAGGRGRGDPGAAARLRGRPSIGRP